MKINFSTTMNRHIQIHRIFAYLNLTEYVEIIYGITYVISSYTWNNINRFKLF